MSGGFLFMFRVVYYEVAKAPQRHPLRGAGEHRLGAYMTIRTIAVSVSVAIMLVASAPSLAAESSAGPSVAGLIRLPAPSNAGKLPVEKALRSRRSVRVFSRQPLALAEVAQLLWAGQGITGAGGKRTAPSAGALYPLELYLVAGDVSVLPQGIYKYHPLDHSLIRVANGDRRAALEDAALGQDVVNEAAAVIVVAAVYGRTTWKYGQRGVRYVHMEAGLAAQNIHLQAVALDLGTVLVGAFDDDKVKKIIRLPSDEQPLCLLPVGRIKPR